MARILLIDDEEVVLRHLGNFLKSKGHDVTVAMDGHQAINILRIEEFDLVITDIVMPEQDGFEVIMFLKGKANPPKIIVITGGSPTVDIHLIGVTSEELKADRVIIKPIIFKELDQAVNDVLCQ